MKIWNEPKMKNLGIESTKTDDCSTKDKHDHCPACKESSSDCLCKPMEPILPGIPVQS